MLQVYSGGYRVIWDCWGNNCAVGAETLASHGWDGREGREWTDILLSSSPFFFVVVVYFVCLVFFFSLLGFSYCGIYEWNNIISHCFSCLKYLSVKQRQCGRWTFKLKLNLRLFNTSRGMSSVLFSNLKDNKWKGSQIICKCWRNCFQETETNFLFVTLA